MIRWLSRPGSDAPLHTQGAATSTWRCHGETLLVNNHDAYSVFCRRRDRRLQPLTFQLRHHPNHPGDRTIICRQRRRRRQTLRPPSYGMLQKSSADCYTRRRSVKCSSTTITNNITLPPTHTGHNPGHQPFSYVVTKNWRPSLDELLYYESITILASRPLYETPTTAAVTTTITTTTTGKTSSPCHDNTLTPTFPTPSSEANAPPSRSRCHHPFHHRRRRSGKAYSHHR